MPRRQDTLHVYRGKLEVQPVVECALGFCRGTAFSLHSQCPASSSKHAQLRVRSRRTSWRVYLFPVSCRYVAKFIGLDPKNMITWGLDISEQQATAFGWTEVC
eukprot:SAG11_NODE_215_length_12235_cov_11.843276_2_plen_103_part_00